jgi:hypothetical protein
LYVVLLQGIPVNQDFARKLLALCIAIWLETINALEEVDVLQLEQVDLVYADSKSYCFQYKIIPSPHQHAQ